LIGVVKATPLFAVIQSDFDRDIISPPLKKGEKLERTLAFDVNAEPSDVDGHQMPIRALTQYAEVILEMPEGRNCKTSEILVDGKPSSLEPQPQMLDEGRRVVWKKQNPKLGSEYTVMCYHKREER
jgi:hypothetical protein